VHFFDKKKQIYIAEGGNNLIGDKLSEYSKKNIKLNSQVSSIKKEDNLWTVKDSNNTYHSKHVIITVDILALKNIDIKGVDINYFKKMIGGNNFLRMYTYHDNVQVNKTTVIPHIFKQIIPINNNIIMSCYCDNKNAIKSDKLLKTINNKEIDTILNKYITATPVKDKIIKCWPVGTHYFKPAYNYKKNYFSQNDFSIVGEIIGFEQGWMEAAVHSVNNWYENVYNL
jgi:hypothetical protein